jgi:hypothetical protein
MSYKALKPIRFDKYYAIGEIISNSVVDPKTVKRLIENGKVAEIVEAPPPQIQSPLMPSAEDLARIMLYGTSAPLPPSEGEQQSPVGDELQPPLSPEGEQSLTEGDGEQPPAQTSETAEQAPPPTKPKSSKKG